MSEYYITMKSNQMATQTLNVTAKDDRRKKMIYSDRNSKGDGKLLPKPNKRKEWRLHTFLK